MRYDEIRVCNNTWKSKTAVRDYQPAFTCQHFNLRLSIEESDRDLQHLKRRETITNLTVRDDKLRGQVPTCQMQAVPTHSRLNILFILK